MVKKQKIAVQTIQNRPDRNGMPKGRAKRFWVGLALEWIAGLSATTKQKTFSPFKYSK